MRFSAVEILYRTDGLRLERERKATTTMAEVVERGFSGLSRLLLPGLKWDAGVEKPDPYWVEGGQIAFIDGGQTRLVEGCIAYTSMAELVSFIFEHIDPAGPGALSELKTSCGSSLAAMEEKIGKLHRASQPRLFPIVRQDEASPLDTMVPLMVDGEQVWAWKPLRGRETDRIFSVESRREISGRPIPVLKFIKPLVDFDREMNTSEADFMFFDGERVDWAGDLNDVPLDLVDEIERDGYLCRSANFDLLPQDHLEPVALVRIPPREEFQELLAGGLMNCVKQGIASLPHPAFGRPAFTLDTHHTLSLSDDLPVLDSPEAAAWLLSHVTRGIFIPNRPPRQFPVKLLPETESYQALCRFRRVA